LIILAKMSNKARTELKQNLVRWNILSLFLLNVE